MGPFLTNIKIERYNLLFDSVSGNKFPLNRLTPNDTYMGRTAPLTSKRCILFIYSTNIGTEYFKHALYSPVFSLQNAFCFTMLTCLVPIIHISYTGCAKIKKNYSGAKGLKFLLFSDLVECR
jgi:hypothetical protein